MAEVGYTDQSIKMRKDAEYRVLQRQRSHEKQDWTPRLHAIFPNVARPDVPCRRFYCLKRKEAGNWRRGCRSLRLGWEHVSWQVSSSVVVHARQARTIGADEDGRREMSSITEEVWLKEPGSYQEMLQLKRAQACERAASTGVLSSYDLHRKEWHECLQSLWTVQCPNCNDQYS